MTPTEKRAVLIWDYPMNESEFLSILSGKTVIGTLDRDWAARRLLEYAPYEEIVRMLGYPGIVEAWRRVGHSIRSESRRRGFDFLAEWLPTEHPELL